MFSYACFINYLPWGPCADRLNLWHYCIGCHWSKRVLQVNFNCAAEYVTQSQPVGETYLRWLGQVECCHLCKLPWARKIVIVIIVLHLYSGLVILSTCKQAISITPLLHILKILCHEWYKQFGNDFNAFYFRVTSPNLLMKLPHFSCCVILTRSVQNFDRFMYRVFSLQMRSWNHNNLWHLTCRSSYAAWSTIKARLLVPRMCLDHSDIFIWDRNLLLLRKQVMTMWCHQSKQFWYVLYLNNGLVHIT